MRRLSTRISAHVNVTGGNGNVPDSIERVRSETGTDGDTPTEQEGREERTLERTDEDDRLCRTIVRMSCEFIEGRHLLSES